MEYTHLSTKEIAQTLAKIQTRIIERFPDSSLSKLAGSLQEVIRDAQDRARWLVKPNYPLRVIFGLFIALVVLLTLAAVWGLELGGKGATLADFAQMLQAATNDLVLIGGATALLCIFERRLKTRKALRILHRCRALAHVIDLMQLAKDPTRLQPGAKHTASSPKLALDTYQMGRYLEYCTELLSIISKVSAVYAQHFDDSVVLATTTEIEMLTGSLSQKIWTKIALVQSAPASAGR